MFNWLHWSHLVNRKYHLRKASTIIQQGFKRNVTDLKQHFFHSVKAWHKWCFYATRALLQRCCTAFIVRVEISNVKISSPCYSQRSEVQQNPKNKLSHRCWKFLPSLKSWSMCPTCVLVVKKIRKKLLWGFFKMLEI